MSEDGDRTGGEVPTIPLVGASSGRRSSTGKKRKRRHKARDLNTVDVYAELVRDSDLEPIAARELLARTAVDLRETIDALNRKRRENGSLNGEEARGLVGAASNLRRVLEQLGAGRPTSEEETDFGG